MSFNSNFDDDAYKSIGFQFIRVYNVWHHKIHNILKRHDLTHSQFVVLAALGYLLQKDNDITQVTIAKFINIDTMTLSKILKKLTKQDYITKKSSSKDPRANCILLTKLGHNCINEAIRSVEQVDQSFFGKIDLKEQIQLINILDKLGESHD
ncbi:MarR family winged helix-turn-helix transcriptional regulator [Lactococcus garvieae]|jgi:DNA-binding MarR family transcriptional regulator|uniref:MarR family winged helix-turn-helix transcriptional regulator n=1 Tax=Lactococcus TaxID=1357 RepID=UPI0005A9C8FE|nr:MULTISPECIES: MarR family winged helix-turn-helix transcriptional regulator [Lactococcus]MCM6847473.1 MarR family winged helix-turn-helix transcriptional regulator [Lactococcus lactis]MDG6192336.1 MarR family winged helix-turn-helix transcriptional regulator [Lactococcus garvieae]